jgi:lysophospholipase L1-like esterase
MIIMYKKLPNSTAYKKITIALLILLLFSSVCLKASNVMITFRVNMSEAYPANGVVYVGSDWAGWELSKFQLLTDLNHDSIFETTLYLPAGESYNYRYSTSNTDWVHFESMTGTPCGSGGSYADRNIVVPQSSTILPVVCFNSCEDCGSTVRVDLNLSVDMTGATVSPNGVHVTGNFNNWDPGSFELTDNNGDDIYEITIPVIPNLDYVYQFLNGNTMSDAEVVFGTCEFRAKRRVTVLNDSLTVPVVKFGSCNSTGSPITDTIIACIGNSITEGGAGNYFNSWPIQLRNFLGTGYYTENLGVSGTTMSKTGDSPWWNQPQYNYTFSLQPDIILIMLGTNDSKGGNWKPDNYKAAYLEMIEEFRAMDSKPTIYMVTPPKAYSSAYNINDNTIVMKLIPILHEIAFEKAVHLIDMYNTTNYMSANFPDGIHPNAAGAKVIAQKDMENILKAKPLIMQVAEVNDTTENTLYQWYYNDSPIQGSHFRSINVSAEGKYKVAVKMSRMSNDIFISNDFDVVLPQGVTTVGLITDYEVTYGVKPALDYQGILIYPNPASNAINIENASNADVAIFNDKGILVKAQKKISQKETISIPELRNGVYFVRLSENSSSVTHKIVVLND